MTNVPKYVKIKGVIMAVSPKNVHKTHAFDPGRGVLKK